jgi:hypothetical protein
MVCGTFTTTNVPDGEQAAVAALYRANVPPPTEVTSTRQADGTWTVVATWPPCPTDTSHAAQ